jgi:hypothetical protein
MREDRWDGKKHNEGVISPSSIMLMMTESIAKNKSFKLYVYYYDILIFLLLTICNVYFIKYIANLNESKRSKLDSFVFSSSISPLAVAVRKLGKQEG